MGERGVRNAEVRGSIPLISTIFFQSSVRFLPHKFRCCSDRQLNTKSSDAVCGAKRLDDYIPQ